MNALTLIGIGLISFCVISLFISTDRFIVTKQFNGIKIIKDKKTNKKYIQYKNSNLMEIDNDK